jgi:tetratricopeptide (TPR) repeat protein
VVSWFRAARRGAHPCASIPLLLRYAAILGVALAVRLAHLWQMRGSPFFSVLMGDSRSYDEWARRIAGGAWIGGEVFYQAPLYPYFLGVVYALAGHHLFLVRVLQAILGSLACVFLALAGERLFSSREPEVGRRVGLVAGLMLALYAPAIFFDGLIQKSTLDVFFVCLALWLLARTEDAEDAEDAKDAKEKRSRRSLRSSEFSWAAWLWLGLAIGALTLTRENAVVFTVVIAVWAAARSSAENVERVEKRKPPRAQRPRRLMWRWRPVAAFLLGVAIIVLPVAVRNSLVGGGFYVTTAQFGPNLYIGNNPRSDGSYQSLRYGRGAPEYERQDATELAERATGRTLTPAEVSNYWTDKALDFMLGRPREWLALVARKAALLVNATELLDTESQESHAEWSIPLRATAIVGHFGILVPLAALGGILSWPQRSRLAPLYAMLVAYAASVVLFYVFARYRYPLVPMLTLFAAAGAVGSWDLVAGPERAGPRQPDLAGPERAGLRQDDAAGFERAGPRQHGAAGFERAGPRQHDAAGFERAGPRRTLAPGSRGAALLGPPFAIAILVAIAANWPMVSADMNRAVTEHNLGAALQADGRSDDAIPHYRRAIALRADYAPAYNNLASSLKSSGRTADAIATYQQALRVQPDYPEAHYNLANALVEAGRREEAIAHYRQASQAIGGSADVHNNLGIALMADGKVADAVAEFRLAIQAEPNSAKAHRNLGDALLTLGTRVEGLEHLRRAVALEPNDASLRYDLGSALLEAGSLDDAIPELREALRLDPKSAEAHNNLGIALGTQGKLADALAEFDRALALKPDFADAQRNRAAALGLQKR